MPLLKMPKTWLCLYKVYWNKWYVSPPNMSLPTARSKGEYIGDCSLCCAVLQLQLTNICVVILCFFVTNFKCDPIFSRCITNLHNIMHQPTWHFRTLFLRYEFQTTGQNSLLCFIFTVPIPSINRGSNQGFNKWVKPSLVELMKWGHVLMI